MNTQTRPNIFLIERINESGINLLSEFANVIPKMGMPRSNILSSLDEAHSVIIRSVTKIDREFLDHGRRLKVIGRAGTGTDNIDMALAAERKISVITTESVNAVSTAEYAIGQILCLVRKFYTAFEMQKNQNFSRHLLEGRELRMLTVGIIGLGNIGYEVARRLASFGCGMVGYDPFCKDKEKCLKLGVTFSNSLEDLLSQADVVTIHASLNPTSKYLLNKESLKSVKPGMLLVNAARAEIIQDGALLEALASGRVEAAALDVISPEPPYDTGSGRGRKFHHPFLNHPRIIVTPHMAASTMDAQRKIAVQLALEIKKALLV